MRNTASDPELDSLLTRFNTAGGVLDYVFLEGQFAESSYACHRIAAFAGMAEIERRIRRWATTNASEQYPLEKFFRVIWDDSKLTGAPISFSVFWGTNNIEPTPIGNGGWSIPNVDGYKTAFFHPPYSLRGSAAEKEQLFEGINEYVLGSDPERAEIFSWSTDWSNYFEAGHEWWGAFYWTVRPAGSERIVVVGASSTD